MITPRHLAVVLLAGAALAAGAEGQEPGGPATYLITESTVGPVEIGMTQSALLATPRATLEHEPAFSGEIAEAEAVVIDGERIAYVTFGSDRSGGQPVVGYIFTNSPLARTAEGVGPGSLLSDAVAVYGKATITISEIELREYVTFEDHPGRMAIRVGALDEEVWRAGVYPEGEGAGAQTGMFRDDAVILSVEL